MGLTESKLILQVLSDACGNAECHGKRDISDVLSNSEFISYLRKTWACIPQKSKRQISRKPNGGRFRSSHNRHPKETDSSQIVPSRSLAVDINRWNDNPLTFFQDNDSMDSDFTRFPLARCYRLVFQLERCDQINSIRARLIKVAFYRLKLRLCANYLRSETVESIAQIILQSGLVTKSLTEVKLAVSRWASEGKKIESLCRDISNSDVTKNEHLGALFRLPKDVHDEFIRVLPLTGPDRNQEIQYLVHRGISDIQGKEKMDHLARKLFDIVWKPIESSVAQIIQLSGPDASWNLQYTQSFAVQNSEIRPSHDTRSSQNADQREQAIGNIGTTNPTHQTFPVIAQEDTALPYHGSLQGSQAIDWLPNAFDPRQTVQPIFPSNSFGQGGQTPDNIPNVFDPRQSVQPILPSNSFGLQGGQTPDNIPNVFDPRQSVQPILPSNSFDLQGGQTPDNIPNVFDPRQSVQPILPSNSFGLQGGQTPDNIPNVFDPRQSVQPILPSNSFNLQESPVIDGIRNISEMPSTASESRGSAGQYTPLPAHNPRNCTQIHERLGIQEAVYTPFRNAAINCA